MPDDKRFEELLAKYEHVVRNIARTHMQPGRDDVEDLYQECAIVFLKEIRKWEDEKRSDEIGSAGFISAVYVRMKHRAIDRNRRNRPKVKPVERPVGTEVFSCSVTRGVLRVDPLPTEALAVAAISLFRDKELIVYTPDVHFRVVNNNTIEWLGKNQPKHREKYLVEGVRQVLVPRTWAFSVRDIRAEISIDSDEAVVSIPGAEGTPDQVLAASDKFTEYAITLEQLDSDAKRLLDEMLFPSGSSLLEAMHVVGFPTKIPDEPIPDLVTSREFPFYEGTFKVDLVARYFGWTKSYVLEKLHVITKLCREVFHERGR